MRKSKLSHTENFHDRIIPRKPTDVFSRKNRLARSHSAPWKKSKNSTPKNYADSCLVSSYQASTQSDVDVYRSAIPFGRRETKFHLDCGKQLYRRATSIDLYPQSFRVEVQKYTRAGVTSSLNLSIGHYAGGMKREP